MKAQHWIYVFAPSEADEEHPGREQRARFLSAWKADAAGLYQQATYPGGLEGPVQENLFPEVETETDHEWILLEEPPAGNVFLWVTPVALPSGRVFDIEEHLGGSFPLPRLPGGRTGTGVCRIAVTERPEGTRGPTVVRDPFSDGSLHTRWGAGGCEVQLADALAVAERRAEEMRTAASDFKNWHAKASQAVRMSSMVADPCYHKKSGLDRTYLQEKLAPLERGSRFSMVREWNDLTVEDAQDYREGWTWGETILSSLPVVGSLKQALDRATGDPDYWSDFSKEARAARALPENAVGPHLLAQFNYGAGRKEALLKGKWYGRAERLANWLESPAFGETLRDIFSAYHAESDTEEGISEETAGAVDRLVGAFDGLDKTEPGGAYLARLFSQAEVAEELESLLERLRTGGLNGGGTGDASDSGASDSEDEAGPASLLESLEKTRTMKLKEALGEPSFKLLWAMAQKGTGTAFALAESMRPAVIGYAGFERASTSAVASGALFWKALYRERAAAIQVTDGQIRVGAGSREEQITVVQQRFVDEDGVPVDYFQSGRPMNVHAWQMSFNRETLESRLRGAGKVLRAANVGLLVFQLGTHKDGVMSMEGMVLTMQIAHALAEGAVESAQSGVVQRVVVRRLGREMSEAALMRATATLPVVGDTIDATKAAYQVYKESGETTAVDQQRVPDPEVLDYISYGIAGLGALAGLAIATVMSGGMAALVGFGVAVVTGIISCYTAYQDEQERMRYDPLFAQWLPQGSVWGLSYDPGLDANPGATA